MLMAQTPHRSATRICPYYRLPEIGRHASTAPGEHRPNCTAVAPPEPLDRETATALCRSGAYPTCRRYRRVSPEASGRAKRGGHPSLARRLLTSALWVIGIPTAITLMILIAAWITEKVWVPTEHVIFQITNAPWY